MSDTEVGITAGKPMNGCGASGYGDGIGADCCWLAARSGVLLGRSKWVSVSVFLAEMDGSFTLLLALTFPETSTEAGADGKHCV